MEDILIVADELAFTIRDLLQDVRSLVNQNRHRDAGEVLVHISVLTQQMHAIDAHSTWYDGPSEAAAGNVKPLKAVSNVGMQPPRDGQW